MLITRTAIVVGLLASAGCGPGPRGAIDGGAGGSGDGSGNTGDGGQSGCGGTLNCYSVYAHSDTQLYVIDLMAKTLVSVGPFNAPNVTVSGHTDQDIITDLAVAPNNTIYAISNTALYTASATTGQVTMVGSLATCGSQAVALTTTPDGKLWAGDFSGKICNIDISGATPTLGAPITMTGGLALSGDMVAVANGTVYGTAFKTSDGEGSGTQLKNLLVTIDLEGTNSPAGTTTQIGSTGYPKLFGVSYANGQVFGFTHDGTGHVVTIDPTSGVGAIFGTFTDPTTHAGISFAGAGVNSLVPMIE